MLIARKGIYKIKKNVLKQLNYENKKNINSIKGCLKFKKNCENSKKKLKKKINLIFKKGKKYCRLCCYIKKYNNFKLLWHKL